MALDMKCKPTQTPDVGLPVLREKYRQERDKRIRPEGQKQYVEAADDFADYYEAENLTRWHKVVSSRSGAGA